MGDDCDLDCCNCDCFESDDCDCCTDCCDDCCTDGECCCGCGPECCYNNCRSFMHTLCCVCLSEDCDHVYCADCCEGENDRGRRRERRRRYEQRSVQEPVTAQPGQTGRDPHALQHPDMPPKTVENSHGPVCTQQPSAMALSPYENGGLSPQGVDQAPDATGPPSEPPPPSYDDVMSEKMKD